MKKSLAKCLARSNGGDMEKAVNTLKQINRDLEIHDFEWVFKKYKSKEVKLNE
jgi:hypothetical protein